MKKIDKFNIILVFHHGLDTSNFLLEDLTQDFNRGLSLTDTVLVSESQDEIPCHRHMLASRSPVFKAMFTSELSESASGMQLLDHS